MSDELPIQQDVFTSPLWSAPPPPRPGSYEDLRDMVHDEKQRQLDKDREIDDRAAFKINQAQMKAESEAHQAQLLSRLSQLGQTLSAPPPQYDPNVQLRPEELWAGLIGGAITGRFDHAADAVHQIAGQRHALEHQDQVNAYKAQQSQAADERDFVQQQILGEQGYEKSMNQQDRIDQRQDMRERHETSKQVRASFDRADNPGDIDYFARQLQGTEFAPTPDEVAAKKKSAGDKAVKAYNDSVLSLWKTADTINPADAYALEERGRQLVRDYGISPEQLQKVPTSETLASARLDETARHNSDLEKQASEKFDWMKEQRGLDRYQHNKEFTERMKVAWFNAHTARASYSLAKQRGDIASMKYYSDLFKDKSDSLMKDYGKKIDGLQAQIAGKQMEMLDYKPKTKEHKAAQAEIDRLKGELDHYMKLTDEHNNERLGMGVPSVDPHQLLLDAKKFAKEQDEEVHPITLDPEDLPPGLKGPIGGGVKITGVKRIK